jgi:hypothetical protein
MAFYDCSSLTSIELPAGVTSIGDYAFSGCSSLTSLKIPNLFIHIGDRAFTGCNLRKVSIPKSHEVMRYNASSERVIITSFATNPELLIYNDGNLIYHNESAIIEVSGEESGFLKLINTRPLSPP